MLFRSRFLIDASGRRDSVLKRKAGAPLVYDRLVGITAFMPARADINRYTLIESVPDGWWYSALLPDDRCVVTFMTDADLARTGRKDLAAFFLKHLQSAKLTASRIDAPRTDIEVSIAPAMSYRHERSHGDNWLLAGDAAATRDPLSGQGVCKALESGLAAAAAIDGALEGDRNPLSHYSSKLKSAHDRYLRTRTDFYRAERRWPDSPFWQRRQRSN